MTASGAAALRNPVRHSLVLCQTSDIASEAITDAEHVNYIDVRQQHFGDVEIPQDDEPTKEQLSALKGVLAADLPPYADFSIFAPHAQRLMNQVKMHGKRLKSDGFGSMWNPGVPQTLASG